VFVAVPPLLLVVTLACRCVQIPDGASTFTTMAGTVITINKQCVGGWAGARMH